MASSESEPISALPISDQPNLIYLDIAGRMHSLHRMLTEYPPRGFAISTGNSPLDRASRSLVARSGLFGLVQGPVARLVPTNMLKASFERFKSPPENTVLTYSNGHLVFRSEPWIVDVEFVTQVAGYNYQHFRRYRRVIERSLASSSCKRIFSWTSAGVRTIVENLEVRLWGEKVQEIPLAVPARPEFVKGNEGDKVKLLFVGSGNISGQFEIKGGMELLAAYRQLTQKYDGIELIIRSDVPSHWRETVARLPNVTVVNQRLPWEALEYEFRTADIFLFPSYHTPGLVFLDAMSFELPIITTDVWANSEMVVDGMTGLIIPQSRFVTYRGSGIPGWGERAFVQNLTRADPAVVDALVERTGVLIEDAALRRRMGRAGRRRVESGRYSMRNRLDTLRMVFEECMT